MTCTAGSRSRDPSVCASFTASVLSTVWAPLCGPQFSEVVSVSLNVSPITSIYSSIHLATPLCHIVVYLPHLLYLLSELAADYMSRMDTQQLTTTTATTSANYHGLRESSSSFNVNAGSGDVLEIESTLPARLVSTEFHERHRSRPGRLTVSEAVGSDDHDDRYSEKYLQVPQIDPHSTCSHTPSSASSSVFEDLIRQIKSFCVRQHRP